MKFRALLFTLVLALFAFAEDPFFIGNLPVVPPITGATLIPVQQGTVWTRYRMRVDSIPKYLSRQTADSSKATLARFGKLYDNGRLVDSSAVLDTALTGYATVITDTLRCGVDIFGVTCNLVAGITGSSNGAALTFGHIPLAFRSSHTVTTPIVSVTDSGYVSAGYVSIASTGIVTVGKYDQTTRSPSTTFTTTGTKAIAAGTSFRYSRF